MWAYGSRVNGRGHEGSDLDLVLRGARLEKIPIGRLMDFKEAVRESTIPFLVEARDWARLPEWFHREIEREYVVVIGGAPSLREHIQKDDAERFTQEPESAAGATKEVYPAPADI